MGVSRINEELLNAQRLIRVYTGQKELKLQLFGLHRTLEIRELGKASGHWIASNHSVVFGDVRFLTKAAQKIASRIRQFKPEILLTAESKSIFLTGKVAEELGLDSFEVCRKELKSYNKEPISTQINSTISMQERLILDKTSQKVLNAKRIGLIDDVVTTGGNLTGMSRLVNMIGGEVVAKACIWVEGLPLTKQAIEARKDLVFLSTLPEFFTAQRAVEIKNSFKLFTHKFSLSSRSINHSKNLV